jgi:hypothetical protein
MTEQSRALHIHLAPAMYSALARMARATKCPADAEGPQPTISVGQFATELLEIALIESYEKRFGERIGRSSGGRNHGSASEPID